MTDKLDKFVFSTALIWCFGVYVYITARMFF